MKASKKFKALCSRLAAMLLAAALFAGMAMPAYAEDETKEGMWTEEIKIDVDNELALRTWLTMMFISGRLDVDVSKAVDALTTTGVYITNDGIKLTYSRPVTETKPKDNEALRKFNAQYKTSADAEVLGENHIGYDWAEIDWSHANDGYVQVKLNEEFSRYTDCYVWWVEGETIKSNLYMISTRYKLELGKWISIPLPAGSNDYAVTIYPIVMDIDVDGDLTDDELDFIYSHDLRARFKAEIENPNSMWLVSSINIDYENAPLTRAKALEITRNCKTDAEKITAVFNWVAKNIKYDKKLFEEIKAYSIKCKTTEGFNVYANPSKDGTREYLKLDGILNSKSGVCEDYATLMVGMLRSLGIPCKYAGGRVYTGEIVKYYSDDGWAPHGWVAVSPDVEGLNLKALGAGHEEDGWIRLDPTWGKTSSGRTKAAVDDNHKANTWY